MSLGRSSIDGVGEASPYLRTADFREDVGAAVTCPVSGAAFGSPSCFSPTFGLGPKFSPLHSAVEWAIGASGPAGGIAKRRGLRSIMEGILLDTVFSLEGVGEAVISKQVVDGTAPPLYICADGSDRAGDASA